MDNRYKYLLKNTTILTIGQFSSKILQFFLVPLYTSVLSTGEYGSYDLVSTTISLFIPILTLNIADALMRFAMDRDKDLQTVKNIAVWHEVIGCFLAILIVLVFKALNVFPIYSDYYGFIILFFISSAFYQFEVQFAKGEEKVKEIAIAGVLSTIIVVLLNIILLIVFTWGLRGFYIAMICGQVVPSLYLIYKTRTFKEISIHLDTALQKEMLIYCVPLIMATIGWWANSASDRYIVTWMCGLETNGIYSVSYKIPTIITTIQNIFIQAWQISAIKEFHEKNYKKFYGDSFLHLNGLMVAACSGLLLFTKIIAKILYAKEFYGAWVYVPFLLVSSVFNASAGFVGPILSARKDSKTMAVSAVYGTVTNVILNFVLVYIMGVQGAAIATAISSFVIYYCRARKIKNDIEYNDLRLILVSWIIVIAQAILIVRHISMFVQIPFTILIFFLYRKELVKVINVIKRRFGRQR